MAQRIHIFPLQQIFGQRQDEVVNIIKQTEIIHSPSTVEKTNDLPSQRAEPLAIKQKRSLPFIIKLLCHNPLRAKIHLYTYYKAKQ